jgi:hypothetical protein
MERSGNVAASSRKSGIFSSGAKGKSSDQWDVLTADEPSLHALCDGLLRVLYRPDVLELSHQGLLRLARIDDSNVAVEGLHSLVRRVFVGSETSVHCTDPHGDDIRPKRGAKNRTPSIALGIEMVCSGLRN